MFPMAYGEENVLGREGTMLSRRGFLLFLLFPVIFLTIYKDMEIMETGQVLTEKSVP